MSSARAPHGLGKAGGKLWRDMCGEYEFNAAERQTLKSACEQADWVAKLEQAAKDEPLTVKGSMGQSVINPLINEARQGRQTLNQLLKSLKLEDHPSDDVDDPNGVVRPMTRSEASKRANNVRWGKSG